MQNKLGMQNNYFVTSSMLKELEIKPEGKERGLPFREPQELWG